MYADRIGEAYKQTVMAYSDTLDQEAVQNQLNEWAEKGLVEILKPLAECDAMEPCIKLLNWIQPRP